MITGLCPKPPGPGFRKPTGGDEAGCRKKPPKVLLFQTRFPALVALASLGNLLEMQSLRPQAY